MAEESPNRGEPDSLTNAGPVPRRVPTPHERGKGAPGSGEGVVKLAQAVHSLVEHLGTTGETEDAEYAAYNSPPSRSRRFTRSGTIKGEERLTDLLAGGKPAAPLPGGAGAADDSLPGSGSSGAPTPGEKPRGPVIPAALHHRRLKLLIIGGQVFGLTLLVLGLLLGWLFFSERSVPPADGSQVEASKEPKRAASGDFVDVGVSDVKLTAIDAALQAERAGDLEAQKHLLGGVPGRSDNLPGLDYHLAVVALSRGDTTDADTHLTRSIMRGENVAACLYIRATWAGTPGNYISAARNFQEASHAEPFAARPFFYWAECLRRAGQPRASLDQFDRALGRSLTLEEHNYVAFKRKLALLEAGDEKFEAGIAEQANQANSPGETLLLAAATDVQQNRFGPAAEHLRKAARILTPDDFAVRAADYVYQSQSSHPELAAILAPTNWKAPTAPPPAGSAKSAADEAPYVDPAVWPLTSADPGSWPAPKVIIAH